ncbi:MAG: MBL fold metallo-hydrolase [Planctomycetes bacterium]|nr:MBL fold metallo-hydrolase [Planctomycetota bacterium]
MASEWIVLGSGSILPRAGHGCAGYALRRDARKLVLFDCGPGTMRQLGELGFGVADIGAVVLSHFHPDHCWDLFALAFARRNPEVEAPHLELVGPAGLEALLERGAAVYPSRGWTRFENVSIREVDPAASGKTIELDGLKLGWCATLHAPEALAWRAELGGSISVTFSGDSGENPAVAALAQGSELFVCESSFPEERAMPHHLSPEGAGRMAQSAGVRRLLLTHFYPAMEPENARLRAALTFSGTIEVASDRSRHGLSS